MFLAGSYLSFPSKLNCLLGQVAVSFLVRVTEHFEAKYGNLRSYSQARRTQSPVNTSSGCRAYMQVGFSVASSRQSGESKRCENWMSRVWTHCKSASRLHCDPEPTAPLSFFAFTTLLFRLRNCLAYIVSTEGCYCFSLVGLKAADR